MKQSGLLHNIRFRIRNFWNEPSNRIFFFLITGVLVLGYTMFLVETKLFNPDSQIKTFYDAIWWLFVTVSTVGYGDIVPKTDWGKFVGILTVISGVTLFSIFSGSIASVLVDIRLKERRGLGTVNFKDHIMILGWNTNLESIISSIPNFVGNRNFNLVLVNDGTEEDYDEIKSRFLGYNIKFIHGDHTKENVLKRANIEFAKNVIVLADIYGNRSLDDADERTLVTVLTIKSTNPDVKIFAEVIKSDKAKHIQRAGADTIIQNGEFNPILISSSLVSPAMPTFIRELIINYEEPKIKLEDVPRTFVGKTFKDLFWHFREKTKGMAVALLVTEKELTIDDLLSSDSSIDAFIRAKFNEAEQGMFDEGDTDNLVKINPQDDYIITEDDTFAFVIY